MKGALGDFVRACNLVGDLDLRPRPSAQSERYWAEVAEARVVIDLWQARSQRERDMRASL